MKLCLVTDAWRPQTNGVVRTLETVLGCLERRGMTVETIAPHLFRTLPCPSYPEIRLALGVGRRLRAIIESFDPDFIHIATEGPLGLAARRHCVRRKLPFTTAYHTRFPEYIHARVRLPLAWSYGFMRWFHRPSSAVMVATRSIREDLVHRGFVNVAEWSRGVDTDLFRPRDKSWLDLPRPVFLYVGRVAVEKNIEAFLRLDLPGTKLLVGDGPQMETLRRRYPDVVFAGMKRGEELARHYAAADVFVFPSLTDTFGLVQLEALASGIPVAAFPVAGPLDVIGETDVGVLDLDLTRAARAALQIPSDRCRAFAERFSWDACARQFAENLAPIRSRNTVDDRGVVLASGSSPNV
jgi:glycosyltransferase involved in cell wall biosynthesis